MSVTFIGGVSGNRKTDNKPFYLLQFAVPPSVPRDGLIGYEVANIYLSDRSITGKTAIDVFQDFKDHAKVLASYPNIQVH